MLSPHSGGGKNKTIEDFTGLHGIKSAAQELGGLGFRDLHDFNIALLTKQLWCLIQYLSSILARVLKGRYFRVTGPLEDKEAYSLSFGWQSIMAAKPLLKQGLRKTIGSGSTMQVWSDPWIPDIPAHPARTFPGSDDQGPLLRVNTLIREDSREWNIPLIRNLV